MGFFSGGKKDEKKEDDAKATKAKDPKGESQSLPRVEVKKPDPPKEASKGFFLGLELSDKLATIPKERLEEGLRSVLPKGTKVVCTDAENDPTRGTTRYFEIGLGEKEIPDALDALRAKGLLEGQVELAPERHIVLLRATGRMRSVSGAAEAVERFGFRYDIKCETGEVHVQYPPAEVHARWLADEDYRAAYGRWRTQRAEEGPKPRPWHAGWQPSAGVESSPPWVRLRPKENKPDEAGLEFDEKMLLGFAFQGAEIKIMRFNLKVLSNQLTNEYRVYRSLPLTLESLPKEVQDRLNREPDRFRVLREPGRFGASFDLVRQAYEELGGDYFQIEGQPKLAARPVDQDAIEAGPARVTATFRGVKAADLGVSGGTKKPGE